MLPDAPEQSTRTTAYGPRLMVWRSTATGEELLSEWVWLDPPAPNKNRGTLRKVPTVQRFQLMPVLQQDHAQHLRFKRMV